MKNPPKFSINSTNLNFVSHGLIKKIYMLSLRKKKKRRKGRRWQLMFQKKPGIIQKKQAKPFDFHFFWTIKLHRREDTPTIYSNLYIISLSSFLDRQLFNFLLFVYHVHDMSIYDLTATRTIYIYIIALNFSMLISKCPQQQPKAPSGRVYCLSSPFFSSYQP